MRSEAHIKEEYLHDRHRDRRNMVFALMICGASVSMGAAGVSTAVPQMGAQMPIGVKLASAAISLLFFGVFIYLGAAGALVFFYRYYRLSPQSFILTDQAIICRSPGTTRTVPFSCIRRIRYPRGVNALRPHLSGVYIVEHSAGHLLIDNGLPDHEKLIQAIAVRRV